MIRLEAVGQSVLNRTIGRHVEHPARLLRPDLILGDIIPQLLENIPLHVHSAETSRPADLLSGYLVPVDLRRHLLASTSRWIPGERKGMIITVGSTRNGSSHPHLFEVERVEDGVCLTFVDPENTVAARSTFKPSVAVLLQTHIVDNPDLTTQLAYIRFRANNLNPAETRFPAQYAVGKQLLVRSGVPPAVADDPRRVLWSVYLSDDLKKIQSIMATTGQLRRVLEANQRPRLLDKRLATIRGTHTLFPQVFDLSGHPVNAYNHVVARAQQ